jgi:hypothetical protein
VSDHWEFVSGETSDHESVIVDRGNGYFILNTTVGAPNVISGIAQRQSPRSSPPAGTLEQARPTSFKP